MRLKARTDANQREIVEALRAIGCSVLVLSAVGKGCPDILVGYAGKNFLLEIKDGAKKPSDRRLTPDEERLHPEWCGQVAIVESVDRAIGERYR
jgi:Holliday junction resolvase